MNSLETLQESHFFVIQYFKFCRQLWLRAQTPVSGIAVFKGRCSGG